MPKFRCFLPPSPGGGLTHFFFDVFSASLEIDAQDIKVVLPRYYVLQKDIRLGSAFLAGALVFLGKHELQKAVVFGSGWEKLWCSGRRS